MKHLFLLLLLSCTAVQGEDIQTLYVADHQVDCTGVSEQKCLLVKNNLDDEWSYFYDGISGFDYEEGFTYELRVRVEDIDNPPADASSKRYILSKLVSKVPSDEAQDEKSLIGSWRIIKITGLETMRTFPTMVFDEEEKKVTGSAGCNNYFASYELNGIELSFGNAGSTRKMCEDMTVEDTFLKKMDEIAYYKMVKSELHLFDAKDNLIMLAISE